MKIGFVGAGTMGRPMILNLLKAGHAAAVYARRKPVADELAARGAATASSPADAARDSDLTITMLPDSSDVLEVVTGKDGVLDGANPGTVVIDMSTISPSVARHIARVAEERGVQFLDAPVSGGESGAVSGTLSIMVGGKQEVLEKCLPILEVLGKNITHMGEVGMGQTAKLCNQVICALNIEAVCEGLILAKKTGLDLEKFLAVVSAGAAGSWMLSNLAPKMVARDFEPGFRIRLQQKDLRLALSLAEELKAPLPATALVREIFRIAECMGLEEKGTQALISAVERLADENAS